MFDISRTSPRPAPSPVSSQNSRLRGLDGLRALAVILVIIFHFSPTWAPGGFVGVDLFFVISGFLITTLLLRERAKHGRISLRGFWVRRARRILPALATVVLTCATAALFIGGDVLVKIGRQVLGATTFSYNWLAIADGSSYFDSTVAEVFQNLWSLAVEEQFYLLWPLLFLLIIRLRDRRHRVGIVVLGALASAIWMWHLTATGADVTRVYFGTDSHAFGLLAGAALAFALAPRAARATDPATTDTSPQATLRAYVADATRRPTLWTRLERFRPAIGVAGLITILAAAWFLHETGHSTFRWGLPVVALATVAVIWSAVAGGTLARVLDNRVFRVIGNRSYGLYLWHWPVLILLTAAFPLADRTTLILTALVVTIVATELSLRFVENPVRTLGYREIWRRFSVAIAGARSRQRFAALAAGGVVLALTAGTLGAVVTAPRQSSAQTLIEQGAEALEQQPNAHPAPPKPTEGAPSPTDGTRISAFGDSVMLAAAPALTEQFPGIVIDAEVSRQLSRGVKLIAEAEAAGQLRPTVVMAFGTNGLISMEQLDTVLHILGPDRRLVVVTAYAPRNWIDPVNATLHGFADRYKRVEIADWSGAIAPRAAELLAGDHIHPGQRGGELFADTVAGALVSQDERLRPPPAWAVVPGAAPVSPIDPDAKPHKKHRRD